ncbi:arsenate reductase, partial [Plectosphaerella plurivora]
PSVQVPSQVSREQVLAWIKEGKEAGKNYLIVDVRRSDHTGGFIKGSLNLPIESLYPSLSTVYALAKAAGVTDVIWYCVTSRGRGNRAAAWFSDYLMSRNKTSIRSAALSEGILGFALAGEQYTQYIDEFVPEAWKAGDATRHTGQLSTV